MLELRKLFLTGCLICLILTGCKKEELPKTPLPTIPGLTPAPTMILVPKINVLIRTCDTGFDIANSLGEVTNAYVTVQNVGTANATNVQAILEASDEEQVHPDKRYTVQHLPPGYEITLRLTVDTESGVDTNIEVVIIADQDIRETATKLACRRYAIDKDVLEEIGELFKIVATPGK